MSQSIPPNNPMPYYSPGQSYSMPTRTTSAAAVASLVVGVLGCIPFVPGFLAVVLASFGLRATRNPQVGGRGLAIAGLVLGLVSLCGWGGFGGLLGYGLLKTNPARTVARHFLTDLCAGNFSGAAVAAPTLTPAEIQASSDALKPLGPLTNFTFTHYNYKSNFGGNIAILSGVGTFATGSKFFTFTLSRSGSSYTVTSFKFQ